MFWGPIQIVYYVLRGLGFLSLLPYNTFVFFLDMQWITWVLLNWAVYALKAQLWVLDFMYLLSKTWINTPGVFIKGFFSFFVNSDFLWYIVWFPVALPYIYL